MNTQNISFDTFNQQNNYQVPTSDLKFWNGKSNKYLLVIPVINEGERIMTLLKRMSEAKISQLLDILIVDGGTTDGSLEKSFLDEHNITGLLLKTGPGKLSSQLRCAYAYALYQGYEGIVTIDGNNKDNPKDIPKFIKALEEGVDFAQASRFIKGGYSENTPLIRYIAIRLIHAPVLSFASKFFWTDTTQGFRAYSSKMLLDPRVAPFRDIFKVYELLCYLSYRAPILGYNCKELPTERLYPKGEKAPTKISFFRGSYDLLDTLFRACTGAYNP